MFAHRIAFVLAFAFVFSLGACHRDRCLSVCQQREKELGCVPSESCKATCTQLHQASPCAAEFRGWEDCIVRLPTDQWECGIRGQPVPRDKTCPDARAKVMACITQHPQ